MSRTLEFHWYPECTKQRGIKDYGNRLKVKTRYVLQEWERSQVLRNGYYAECIDENIMHDFVCLVYEFDNTGETQSEIEKRLLYDTKLFSDELAFKTLIDEVHESAPGRYVYVLLSTIDMTFVPIYIDRHNVWYRLDVFPLTVMPMLEKPEIFKTKHFLCSSERNEVKMKYDTRLLGRDPRTVETQGLEFKMVLENNLLTTSVCMMYHRQMELISELFNSTLKAFHMKIVIKEGF